MATRTYTSSEVNALKSVHVGLNYVRSRFKITTTAATLTASDQILLARIPNKATVLEWRMHGGSGAAASTGLWKLGIGGLGTAGLGIVNPINGASMTDDSLHAGMSLTISNVYSSYGVGSVNVPFKVSISDDALQQFVWIMATTSSTSLTGSTSLNFTVGYLVGE